MGTLVLENPNLTPGVIANGLTTLGNANHGYTVHENEAFEDCLDERFYEIQQTEPSEVPADALSDGIKNYRNESYGEESYREAARGGVESSNALDDQARLLQIERGMERCLERGMSSNTIIEVAGGLIKVSELQGINGTRTKNFAKYRLGCMLNRIKKITPYGKFEKLVERLVKGSGSKKSSLCEARKYAKVPNLCRYLNVASSNLLKLYDKSRQLFSNAQDPIAEFLSVANVARVENLDKYLKCPNKLAKAVELMVSLRDAGVNGLTLDEATLIVDKDSSKEIAELESKLISHMNTFNSDIHTAAQAYLEEVQVVEQSAGLARPSRTKLEVFVDNGVKLGLSGALRGVQQIIDRFKGGLNQQNLAENELNKFDELIEQIQELRTQLA